MIGAALAWFTGWLTGGGTVIYGVLQALGIIKATATVSATLGGIIGALFGTGVTGASLHYFLVGSRNDCNANQEVISVH